jgi:septum formation protein
MIKNHPPIFLASGSPRRKKLLEQLNLNFKVITVEVNEERQGSESPVSMVKRLADMKLDSAKKLVAKGVIITADTIVVLDNEIIGKPRDESDAKKILKKLSDNTHTVYTGFAMFNSANDKKITDYEKTRVTFRKLSSEEIDNYIKSGSPMDKAGAYGIQDDFGAVFVKKIVGDYYNVVGLPIAKVYSHLLEVI